MSPVWGHCDPRQGSVTVHLSTQEYKIWVPANSQGDLLKCWGVTSDGLAFQPAQQPRGGGGESPIKMTGKIVRNFENNH